MESERLSIQQLQWLVRKLTMEPELIKPYVSEPVQLAYGRNVLYHSQHLEAIVIHLPPGAETAIHDHGCSVGCAVVIEGTMQNTVYQLDSYRYPVEVYQKEVRTGEMLIAPKGQIHKMSNRTDQRVVSLHVYAPRLTETQRYLPYEQVLDFVI
jgi:cysteine dioxygenase